MLAYAKPKATYKLIESAEAIATPLNKNDGYLPRLKGIVYQQLGDFAKAKSWLEIALNIAKKDHDLQLLRMTHRDLSLFYLAQGNPNDAKIHALDSLAIAKQLDHHSSIASIYDILSKILQVTGDNERALVYLNKYTQFITSFSNKNVLGLLTLMDKQLTSMAQQKKVIELENSMLASELTAQKYFNEQNNTIILSLILAFSFISLTVFYFIRNRILSLKVALSMKDTLTGAYGRNYLSHYLPGATARLTRVKHSDFSFGVILIDCDDFKLINERYGHVGGDKALKGIASSIIEQIRANDLLFRWGGDEFVLLCEHVTKSQLNEIAQRLTNTIDNLTIDYDNQAISPTISVGYAIHQHGNQFELDELLKSADEYLYQTKRAGKNSFRGG